MRLENRLADEGINTSAEHPLRELTWLIGGVFVALVLLLFVVTTTARWLAPRLPFEAEVALAERLVDRAPPADEKHRAAAAALQELAERVASRMDLPSGMRVAVRYDDARIVNAYATLGGRITVYRGVLERLQREDALATLLAHEIAHVKHRHVAAGLGRGVALAVVLSVLSADAGAAAAQGMLGHAGTLALLSYSREQEAQADAEALRAVVALYGHGGGMVELFAAIGGNEGLAVEMLRSHPLGADRIAALKALAARQGWALDGLSGPMPASLRPGGKS